MYLKVTFLITLIVVLTSPSLTKEHSKDSADYYELEKEYQEFLEWKEQRESEMERKNIKIKSHGSTLPSPYFMDKNKYLHKSHTRQEWEMNHGYKSPNRNDGTFESNVPQTVESYRDQKNVTTFFDDQKSKNLPPISDGALMGRYVVNQADWTAVSTISARQDIESFPTVNVISFSDGPLNHGSGIPYMYLTPLDFTAQDIMKDTRLSLLMTLAQGQYCRNMSWDPMDPRCARIILSGHIEMLKNGSAEHEIAQQAVFARHPKLIGMPGDHHFFFAKLKIKTVVVLDTFGGPKYVPVEDYLHPSKLNITEQFLQRFPSKQRYRSVVSAFSMSASENKLHPTVRLV